MKLVAGAIVLLAVAVVASAVIVTRAQRPIDVNIGGELSVCTTPSVSYGDTCR